MTIQLYHLLVPSRDAHAAAKRLGELLGVSWSPSGAGPFVALQVNDGLTLDFDTWTEPFAPLHYCFRVDEREFDAIHARLVASGIAYRSAPHGPVDHALGRFRGGRLVYWDEPDGHYWEMLTVSYAR